MAPNILHTTGIALFLNKSHQKTFKHQAYCWIVFLVSLWSHLSPDAVLFTAPLLSGAVRAGRSSDGRSLSFGGHFNFERCRVRIRAGALDGAVGAYRRTARLRRARDSRARSHVRHCRRGVPTWEPASGRASVRLSATYELFDAAYSLKRFIDRYYYYTVFKFSRRISSSEAFGN